MGSVPIFLVALVAGCAPLPPAPEGAVSFGLLGDVPYSAPEIRGLDALIAEMNAQPLDFVVHLGDLGWSRDACRTPWLRERHAQLAKIRHRLVVLPGDNEWSDCWRHGAEPMAKLDEWRALFCEAPKEYCEHRRWEAGGWVFVALNVPGSSNNVRHPEHAPRMRVVLRELDEAATLAEKREGLVILIHANPFAHRRGYDEFNTRLKALAAARPGRVVLVHGDTHIRRDDAPLPGLRRIETPGSPFMGWLRATIRGGAIEVETGR